NRPWPARVTAGLSAFLLAATGFAPIGAAAPPLTGPDGGASTPAGHLAGASGTLTGAVRTGATDLTLITGDTVHLTVDADGRQTATVSSAPRPDGSLPGFWTHRHGDDLYV